MGRQNTTVLSISDKRYIEGSTCAANADRAKALITEIYRQCTNSKYDPTYHLALLKACIIQATMPKQELVLGDTVEQFDNLFTDLFNFSRPKPNTVTYATVVLPTLLEALRYHSTSSDRQAVNGSIQTSIAPKPSASTTTQSTQNAPPR